MNLEDMYLFPCVPKGESESQGMVLSPACVLRRWGWVCAGVELRVDAGGQCLALTDSHSDCNS